ncbi:glycosyltransferase family A protein [Bacteroides caecimuris]|uniref:glycosyltransferase family 2 protein n=1 Tax=Bacteroides caecimuris TaxID=1796613 RepID=UPI0026E54751|nr:glycosyltransferase family A protein [Bacteroides caecimuris]
MDLTLAICMYNAGHFIEKTLGSVMLQTSQDFHLLIVDDSSSDNSIELVEKFFVENLRQYELVKFDENKGICNARRYAERHASTKYMMFLDADDILLPHAVETLWEKIQSDSDLMAVGCYLDYIDSKGKKLGGGLYIGETTKEGFYAKAAAGKLIFMQPTAIYNREISLRAGGYEIDGFPKNTPRYQDYCEDLDLWTRMSDFYTENLAIVVVPETLALYRKGGGLSSSSFNMILKMRYTKTNVRRRRRGERNLTFCEFYDSLSEKELASLRREAFAADYLRNGAILLKRGNVIKGPWLILRSIVAKPLYFIDKLKHNL